MLTSLFAGVRYSNHFIAYCEKKSLKKNFAANDPMKPIGMAML